ncbi:MAG: HlyD family type I secretion periplasmic adaptor subunit [Methylocystis silviterrae]
MSSRTQEVTEWRPFAIAGYIMILLTFGVAGGWAAIAKIDRAVVAPASISVETNRKSVQHFEGGIVREILIKEGDHVSEGQVLLRLEKTQAQANTDLVRNQLYAFLALEARLLAERDEKSEIAWPVEFDLEKQDPVVSGLIVDQVNQFNERRASLLGQIKILESKANQLRIEISGIDIEKDSTEKQTKYINEELVGLRRLLTKHLVPTNRVLTMERERTRLEGVIGKAIADKAKVEGAISEIGSQIAQLKQKQHEDIATSLLDVRQKIGDFRQKSIVAADVLRRVAITAPRAGTVQNMKVFTLGQVVRSGELLLEVVPEDERLIIYAQFSPTDIDVIHEGQRAEIRFPAFHSRSIPLMTGELESISSDRLVDEASKQPYYLGIISIDRAEVPEEYRSRLRSGMPAEVLVAAGERTVLDYLISPLQSSLTKTFIEQ